jgi:nitrite reductase/ring-hydroxylating ferredoxin subunit
LLEAEPFAAKLGDMPIALYKLDGLSQGFVEDCTIECPLNQAWFDIATGRCLTPPATIDLRAYAVKGEGDAVDVRTQSLAREEVAGGANNP